MARYKLHPLVAEDDLLDKAVVDELVDSIRTHGQLQPCLSWKGWIMDGGNRFRACEKLGLPVRVQEIEVDTEPQAIEVAQQVNDTRRHRTPSQLAARAARIADYLDHLDSPENVRTGADNGDRRRNSAAARAAAMTGASQRATEQALRVKQADPSLLRRVERGEVTIKEAERQVAARPPVAPEPAVPRTLDATPRDALGVKLTNAAMVKTFEDAGAFHEAVNALRVLRKSLATGIENSPAAMFMRAQTVDIDLKNVIEHITQCAPYAVCPYCGGEGTDKHCQNKGWVSKLVFSQAPESMRRVMEARGKKERGEVKG